MIFDYIILYIVILCFLAGPRTVVNYGTVQGYILGWDIRANRTAWKLKHDLSKGNES